MRSLSSTVMTVLFAAAATGAALADQAVPPAGTPAARQNPQGQQQGQQGQQQGQQGQSQQAPPGAPVTYKETVVVSASKTEQQLVDAPATMTVIGEKTLSVAPSNDYADILRAVPGVNVTQLSARDVNVTSRASTSSLATSQLAVVDGRSLYQDFFGFTMWDFMPANLDEIKRIEVIRGPASAVWGANALEGVINVITKAPREMIGSSVTFGAGTFGRSVDNNGASAGSLFYIRGLHAQALNDRWAYKVSAGMYSSDPLARPIGLIPNGTGTSYPAYSNSGTSQPKFDARVDYDFPDGVRKLEFSGGVAGTSGIMHSGIGPFDINRGSTMSYGKMTFTRKAFSLQVFLNALNGKAHNLLTADAQGNPIGLAFNTKTFDIEVGDTHLVAGRHALTYGGNLRLNHFNLTIAPGQHSRTEGGAYLQDEMVINDHYRLVAGARIDKFSSIDQAVFSPRVAFVVKPRADQSVRVSYNRAFRAPSMVNNNLDITIATPLPLAAITPAFGSAVFPVPTAATGNPNLTDEHLDAFEIAYTANLRQRATVSAAWYYTRLANEILFTQTGTWTTPPPGFPGLGPYSPALLWAGLYQAGIRFPSSFTYLNLGTEKNKGLELGVSGDLTGAVSAFVNYSYQAQPIPEFPGLTPAEALAEVNLPAKHRFNIGVSCSTTHGFGALSVSHSASAFWQDVLDARYHGETKPYTTVNLTVGVKWAADRYVASLKITDLANQAIQEHIFGDVIKRQVVGELTVHLPK
jgi:outer membrane receptor protein involved in Fe transport